MTNDLTWCLSPHGKSLTVARWVVKNYKQDTYENGMQETWVTASEQIIEKLLSRRLIRNSIQTPDGTILVSRHRHDFVSYTDANGKGYMVDGGLEYLRRSANNDYTSLDLYDDEPHEVQRDVSLWGTYGKNGDQPLSYISVAEMETAHLEAVLRLCNPTTVIKNCMEKELEMRNG
jgi:hypothetical protein